MCDPIDSSSQPGSVIPEILQARTMEWAAISFSSAWKWKLKVKSFSLVWLFATPWIAARQAFLSITNSRSLLKLMSIELVMPSSHLILCCPLLLLPPIPSSISLFQWVNSLHEVAKVLELKQFSYICAKVYVSISETTCLKPFFPLCKLYNSRGRFLLYSSR